MRIIAGELRGRRLRSPEGRGTRPMLDRVREALFSSLGGLVEDALVLDLFAGTGSLGLEALSRGARRCVFVERDPRTVGVLRANVEELGLAERSVVRRQDALRPGSWAAPDATAAEVGEDGAAGAGGWAEVVLYDPPYPFLRGARRKRVLEVAAELAAAVLAPGGVLVLHAPRGELREPDLRRAGAPRERTYGTTSLWYVERVESPA